jgi:hypothetical protein
MYLDDIFATFAAETKQPLIITIEIFPRKTLKINCKLNYVKQQEVMNVLQGHSSSFAWDYEDMKAINP